MLTIAQETLPQSCLSYYAFRVAFKETLERIALAKQIGQDPFASFGFLTEVPFLTAVPPHIQLDLLAETWARHVCNVQFEANLVDESVVYAVCETAARVVEEEPAAIERFLRNGPLEVEFPADEFLASELRSLHLNLSHEGDFLLIGQFQDMAPEEAAHWKNQFELDEERFEPMFDVLGRWYMSVDFMSNVEGLLQERELAQAISIIGLEQQPLC